MINYEEAQRKNALIVSDKVIIRERINLLNTLYSGRYYDYYFFIMDEFIGREGIIMDMDSMGYHIIPNREIMRHGYAYYMVDKVETYNIEEDI